MWTAPHSGSSAGAFSQSFYSKQLVTPPADRAAGPSLAVICFLASQSTPSHPKENGWQDVSFQMPCVLRQEGPRPYWYVRYRRKVLVGKNGIERREVWHTLGDCSKITKRQAQRLRDEILREVDREVYTVQSQILFRDFAELYMKQHTVALAPGGSKRDLSLDPEPPASLLRDDAIVRHRNGSRCTTFLNAKHAQGLSWWTRRGLQAVHLLDLYQGRGLGLSGGAQSGAQSIVVGGEKSPNVSGGS